MSEEDVSLILLNLYELISSLGEAGPEPVDRVFGDYADDCFELRLPADYPEGEQVLTQGAPGHECHCRRLARDLERMVVCPGAVPPSR